MVEKKNLRIVRDILNNNLLTDPNSTNSHRAITAGIEDFPPRDRPSLRLALVDTNFNDCVVLEIHREYNMDLDYIHTSNIFKILFKHVVFTTIKSRRDRNYFVM